MLVLITYDVNTATPEGRRRLRKVSKACEDYGRRVQNSVFECEVDAGKLLLVKDRLIKIIDAEKDSLRFYILGNEGRKKVEHFGAKPSFIQNFFRKVFRNFAVAPPRGAWVEIPFTRRYSIWRSGRAPQGRVG